jgi:hypothetical protein
MNRLRGMGAIPRIGCGVAGAPVNVGAGGTSGEGIGTGGVTGNGSDARAPGAIASNPKEIRKPARRTARS